MLVLAACGDNTAGEDRLGGATTIDNRTGSAFQQPAANLDDMDRMVWKAGTGPFDFLWEIPKLGPGSYAKGSNLGVSSR